MKKFDHAKDERMLVSFTEASQMMGVSVPTIHQLVADGKLDVVQLKKWRRVTTSSIRSFCKCREA